LRASRKLGVQLVADRVTTQRGREKRKRTEAGKRERQGGHVNSPGNRLPQLHVAGTAVPKNPEKNTRNKDRRRRGCIATFNVPSEKPED